MVRSLAIHLNQLIQNISVIPEVYPELDTLVVTGNRFGVMEDEDIFGSNFRHGQLTLVNISNNAITSFGAQTFIGMPRVEYFYLAHNKLDSVSDAPFDYFTSLKLIDLEDVFGDHVSVHARADIIRQLFINKHSFIDLQEIVLASNKLDRIHSDTFCNVSKTALTSGCPLHSRNLLETWIARKPIVRCLIRFAAHRENVV